MIQIKVEKLRKVFVLFYTKTHFILPRFQPSRLVTLVAVDVWIQFLPLVPRERILLIKLHTQYIFSNVLLVSIPVKISAVTQK